MKISYKVRKYLYWSISFISIVVILMSIYFHLGGFEKITIGEVNSPYYSIAGKWLKGDISRKEEGLIFNEFQNLILTKKMRGVLCIMDYKNDTLSENEVCRFVGIMLENEISSIPTGIQVIEVSADKSYQAALSMHPLVMPNTQKVEEQLLKAALENGDQLDNFTMELYFEDNSVIVQMFAQR